MSWNSVEIDFGGEETANFGTREESGAALYQLHTLATISHSNSEEISSLPHLKACGSPTGMCVAVDDQISIFNESCQELKKILGLDSEVELGAWADDLPFLVLAERNGTVHFVHSRLNRILFSQSVLPSKEIREEGPCFKQISITKDLSGNFIILLLTANSTLVKFSNVNLEKLEQVIQKGDFAAAKKLHCQIAIEDTDLSCVHNDEVTDMTTVVIGGQMHIVTTGGGDYVMGLWSFGEKTEIRRRAKPNKFIAGKLVKCLSSGKYIFTSDEENNLYLWNTSLLLLSVWPLAVRDFYLLGGDGTGEQQTKMQLVMLTAPDQEGTGSQLKVIDLPSLQCSYTLAVDPVSVLATTPSNQDSIYFIEGRRDDDIDNKLVSMVMVRCLMEALPETRFHRLLQKKQFDEAEKFAKLFNLNVEVVYQSKAEALLDQASTWSPQDPVGADDLCGDLIACLDKIQDTEFVVSLCSEAAMPTLEETAKVLQYGRARVTKLKGKEETDQRKQDLISSIVESLHRLATFQLVYGSSNFSITDWDAFLNGDLLDELTLHLGLGNLARASVVWNRHKEDFLTLMTQEVFEQLLGTVPRDCPSGDIIPWLRDDLIPFVCQNFQSGKKLLIIWIEERVACLEVTEKAAWPSNGLELAELMLSGTQNFLASSSGSHFAQALAECQTSDVDCRESVSRLKDLVRCLQELHALHTKYKCFLTLDQFRRETTESISFRMLERVAALELVPGAIASCVTPYAQRHHLDVDTLLLRYIEDLLEDTTLMTSYEASWEAKAISVIRCIKDLECQCEAIYVLMQGAHIPWSRGMEKLVQYGLSLKHPKVAQLKERFHLVELREMLFKYDLRSAIPGDPESMRVAVKHILSSEGPSIMEDALQVVRSHPFHLYQVDAYLFRMKNFIKNSEIDKCLELLTALPKEEMSDCLTRLLLWTQVVLNDPPERFPDDQSKHHRLLVGQAAVRLLSHREQKDGLEGPLQLVEVQNILHLQMEYGLLITLDLYRDEGYRARLLKKAVVDHFREAKMGAGQKEPLDTTERKSRKLQSGNFIRVARMGELLGVSADELQGQLALRAAQSGQVETAIKKCRELSETMCSPKVAYTIYHVCHAVCGQLARGRDLVGSVASDLLYLMQKASTSCQPDLLVDCFELCTKIHSLARVSDQCESGEYGISVQMGAAETKKDPYEEYAFESFFKEDSLVLDAQGVVPLAADFTLACVPQTRPRDALPLEQARVAGALVSFQETQEEALAHESDLELSHIAGVGNAMSPLYQTLREHNQCEVAFHYLMGSLGATLVHLAVNKEAPPVDDQAVSSAVEHDVKRMVPFVHLSKQSLLDLSSALLNKIFSSRKVDRYLALCYLATLPTKVAKEQIKKLVYNAGQNYKRIMAIAEVGCEMAKLSQDTALLGVLQDLNTSAMWGERLLKFKISFKEAFSSAEKRKMLLPQLITHPETGLDLIIEYCRDFNLDEQEALMMFVRLHLLPSDMQPIDEGQGSKPLDRKVILSAVELIVKRGTLVQILKDNIDKINCYDYERLHLVLHIINQSGLDLTDQTHSTEVGLKLLEYLEAYTRTKPPTEYEIMFQQRNEEEGLMLTTRPLSPLSKTRLPFHPLIKGGQWKILSCELSEETLGQLLPIAEELKLSTDQLYVTTIQNIIRAKQHAQRDGSLSPDYKGGEDEEKPSLFPKRVDLETLTKVKDLLLRVDHPEMAVATARFIAKELPVSKEKVMALKVCELLAMRWREIAQEGTPNHQKAIATYERLVTERKGVSTEETLHRHGLAEAPFTQMIATPAKLITKLYEHSSIEQRMQSHQQGFPDINAAANEIAKINKCNMDKIRLHLLDQWLPQPATTKQDDTTMNFSFGSLEEDKLPEEERSLMRLKYLLQKEEKEDTVMFLLNVAFKKVSTHISNGCQVRALRCIFSLADDKTIQNIYKQSVAELREYLKNLVYIGQFESLNIAMDLSTFESSNKAGLLRGMWRNHNHEPRSVRLISNLCLEYSVHDKSLWNSVLLQLQKFGMLDYLEYVLVQLAGLVELRSVQCLPKVWSVVLSAPFTSMCAPLSEEQAQKCRRMLSLLQRCPVLFEIDLIRLGCQFVRVEMYAEALACLLHMPDKTKKDVQIDTLLQNRHEQVLAALTVLKEKRQPLPEHQQIVAEVQRHLAASNS